MVFYLQVIHITLETKVCIIGLENSYWYIRHVPYKTPIPFFGSDYHRVLNLKSQSEEVNQLYFKYPNENFVGTIKSRIPELIVKDPDVIKKLLSTDFANFHCRGIELDKSGDVCIRNNLFYAEGEKWTLLREGLESLLNNMDCELEVRLHDCLSGINGDVNVQQFLSEVLDVLFKDFLFEGKDDGLLITNIRKSVQKRSYMEKFKSYLKEIFPSLYVLFRLVTIPEQLTASTNEALSRSKLLMQIRKIGLTEQINANYGKGDNLRKVSEMEIAYSTICLFITKGYIPCLNLITSLLFELARNPQTQETLRNCPISDVDYLDLSIKEALRLHCPYSTITRKCVKSYQIPDNDMIIDKKITVTVPIEAIHKDPQHYEEPHVFNPDRFLEINDVSRHPFAFLPFGAGPRKCIGEHLAMTIIRKVTMAILKKYKIKVTEKTPPQLPVTDHNFMKIIKSEIWLKFTPLQST
ncbi:unnamed protein product [Parnassius apollo]|uniref:unspecific monooxygenase n=1 Tax=Parnassius apollo TaxID=110799 RepID=A0A8S3WUP2_PARAO|nr:unnamed protein product [Parnassius apollo]